MKTTRILLPILFALSLSTAAVIPDLAAQNEVVLKPKSGAIALGLSLVIPGLGHRYVNNGHWGGAGTVFLAADVTLWLGLAASISQENHYVTGYTNVVALGSGNTLEGKNRAFELSIGTYDSSQDYIDALLRSRQWDRTPCDSSS